MLRPEEKITFGNFRATYPEFAGRDVACQDGPDPPDFICVDSEGWRVGVELGEWLNPGQMAANVEREQQEDSFLDVLGSENEEPPKNIGLVWLGTRAGVALDKADAETFSREMYACIGDLDHRWPKNPEWHWPQGYVHTDFSKYSCLAKYIQTLHLRSREHYPTIRGSQWICFPARGGAYSPRDAVDVLLDLLRKKTAMYARLHQQERLDELYLVAYYDRALIYNTPYFAPGVTLVDVARLAAAEVARCPGPFQKVFLFNALPQDRQVIQLWP